MWKPCKKTKVTDKDKRVEKIVNKLKETHADTHQFSSDAVSHLGRND